MVYSWSFEDLRQLLVSNPQLRSVFERSVSSDLNEKVIDMCVCVRVYVCVYVIVDSVGFLVPGTREAV